MKTHCKEASFQRANWIILKGQRCDNQGRGGSSRGFCAPRDRVSHPQRQSSLGIRLCHGNHPPVTVLFLDLVTEQVPSCFKQDSLSAIILGLHLGDGTAEYTGCSTRPRIDAHLVQVSVQQGFHFEEHSPSHFPTVEGIALCYPFAVIRC
jgi:hypothetical protein